MHPLIITKSYRINYLKKQFKDSVGYDLDLESPRTFNEKLQWYKLNYWDKLMLVCADKIAVRNYVKNLLSDDVLIPLAGKGVYDSVDEIDFESLPTQFVLKTTNGSGTNIVCKDKSKLDIEETKNALQEWMKPEYNHYFYSFERCYRGTKPRIICEEFIQSKTELRDYKFLCFNGKVDMLFVTTDREKGKLTVDFFDRQFKHLPFTRYYPNTSKKLLKPRNFEKMLKIAEVLSKDFPFCRIDLYDVDGIVKFGEITFYPGNGMEGFRPKEWDRKLGDMFSLPQKNTRSLYIDLYPNLRSASRRVVERAYNKLRGIHSRLNV
ncbi:MAG TPA: ATP-grasp fold amidoligase family protein [Candidatus Babeliaceae bacterium]|nr:ATP-grasp fold amidoligase family protein [Candidatus Babeliaceae bacterium]